MKNEKEIFELLSFINIKTKELENAAAKLAILTEETAENGEENG